MIRYIFLLPFLAILLVTATIDMGQKAQAASNSKKIYFNYPAQELLYNMGIHGATIVSQTNKSITLQYHYIGRDQGQKAITTLSDTYNMTLHNIQRFPSSSVLGPTYNATLLATISPNAARMLNVSNSNSTNYTNTTATIETPFYQQNGKVSSNNILDVTNGSARIQTSFYGTGLVKGISVRDLGTFSYVLKADGVIDNGTGKGFMRTADGEMASYIANFTGQSNDKQGYFTLSGTISFTSMQSLGKLAFLNKMLGLFKAEINQDTNTISLQIWEHE